MAEKYTRWDTQVLQKQLVLAFLAHSSQVPKEAPRVNWQRARLRALMRQSHSLPHFQGSSCQEQGLAGLGDQAWGLQGDLHSGARGPEHPSPGASEPRGGVKTPPRHTYLCTSSMCFYVHSLSLCARLSLLLSL